MKAVYRGAGFQTETRLPGANNEEELTLVLKNWLPESTDIGAHLDAYGRSYWALRSYLVRVFGQEAFAVLDSKGSMFETLPAHYRADVLEVLTLPALTGLDPTDPQSAEWALFLCHHWEYAKPISERVKVGRFAHPSETYKYLQLVGVSFEYLEALDCGPTPLYPLEAILDAWGAGVPIEYAREAIYGVSG